MKYIILFGAIFLFSFQAKSQKVYDPCQQLDTTQIRNMMEGTWVDAKDSTHVLIITDDSLTEKIMIPDGADKKLNISYFSYKFTDNMFSSDAVTCYSVVEYIPGFPTHTDFAINSITQDYMLWGATGKTVFKRRK